MKIEDGNSVMSDVTSLAGDRYDFLDSVELGKDIDAPTASARVGLLRDVYDFSLAHDIESSALNLTFADAYVPFLDLARRILIETAVVPREQEVRDIDFVPVFDGFIDSVDWGDDIISLAARDKMATLEDTFIEDEQEYAAGALLEVNLQSIIDDNDPASATPGPQHD